MSGGRFFRDNRGRTHSADKILRMGESEFRGEVAGKAVYEYDVWVEGIDAPVQVDWRIAERLLEYAGQVISAAPGMFVINLPERASCPILHEIIGWIVDTTTEEQPIPITIYGVNNGERETVWPILSRDGTVVENGDLYESLEEYVSDTLKERGDA